MSLSINLNSRPLFRERLEGYGSCVCLFRAISKGNNNRGGGKGARNVDDRSGTRSNYRTVINKCCVTIVYSPRSSTLSFLRRLARATYMALRLAAGLYGVFESRAPNISSPRSSYVCRSDMLKLSSSDLIYLI